MEPDYKSIALYLFGLLDDIDTASDLAKADDKLYRNLVDRTHKKRFNVAETDGYSVEFTGSIPTSPPENDIMGFNRASQ